MVSLCCISYFRTKWSNDRKTKSRSASLTRYFFIIQTPGGRYDDEAGTSLADDQSARAYAESFIEELKAESPSDCDGWLMIVQDAGGRLVCSIPFSTTQDKG
jgi:hypothetical protein